MLPRRKEILSKRPRVVEEGPLRSTLVLSVGSTVKFVRNTCASTTRIVGINGNSEATLVGTVKWSIEDDAGVIHDIILPNTYYTAQARNRLLSPQHWAQQAEDNYPAPNGTWCAMYSNKIKLYWDQQRYMRTIYLSPRSNVA